MAAVFRMVTRVSERYYTSSESSNTSESFDDNDDSDEDLVAADSMDDGAEEDSDAMEEARDDEASDDEPHGQASDQQQDAGKPAQPSPVSNEPSIPQFLDEATAILAQCAPRIFKAWESLGLRAHEKQERHAEVLRHLETLLINIAAQEEATHADVVRSIEDLKTQRARLCESLDIRPIEHPSTLTPIELEAALIDETEQLQEEEDARVAHVKSLEDKVAEYSKLLELDQDQTADASVLTDMTSTDLNITQTLESSTVAALTEKANALENAYNAKRDMALNFLREIKAAWLTLGISPSTEFDRRIVNGIDNLVLSQTNLQKLQDLANELAEKKTALRVEIDTLTDKIRALWTQTNRPSEYQTQFLVDNAGYTPVVRENMLHELKQLDDVMQASLQNLIETAKSTLRELWSKCYISAEEQQRFDPSRTATTLEGEYVAYQTEIENLKRYHDENQVLFKLILEREALLAQVTRIKAGETSKERQTNRGGVWLKEEKLLKQAEKDLPKLEQQIRTRIDDWETHHGTFFLKNGVRYLDILDADKLAAEEAKSPRRKLEPLAARQGLVKGLAKSTTDLPSLSPKFTPIKRSESNTDLLTRAGTKSPVAEPSTCDFCGLGSEGKATNPTFQDGSRNHGFGYYVECECRHFRIPHLCRSPTKAALTAEGKAVHFATQSPVPRGLRNAAPPSSSSSSSSEVKTLFGVRRPGLEALYKSPKKPEWDRSTRFNRE